MVYVAQHRIQHGIHQREINTTKQARMHGDLLLGRERHYRGRCLHSATAYLEQRLHIMCDRAAEARTTQAAQAHAALARAERIERAA